MTTVAESPRKAEGRIRRTTVTPSLPQPGAVPLCPSLLLQHPAELKRGGVGRVADPWRSCVLNVHSAYCI